MVLSYIFGSVLYILELLIRSLKVLPRRQTTLDLWIFFFIRILKGVLKILLNIHIAQYEKLRTHVQGVKYPNQMKLMTFSHSSDAITNISTSLQKWLRSSTPPTFRVLNYISAKGQREFKDVWPGAKYHVSQKKRARKTTDRYGDICFKNLNNILLFTYPLATLFTYHLQETEMIFIR